MKVAVLGCGGLGSIHANIYAKLDGVELTGVCDIRPEVVQNISNETGAPAFASFEEMLSGAEFDAISIVLPTYLHKEYTVKAAKARKHIICEKPIALTPEQAEEMIATCRENDVQLYIGHVVRFFPDYVNMKAAIDAGQLGNPGVAHASRIGDHPGKARQWYYDKELSGGIIKDLMIHDLDFLRWTLGEVDTAYTQHTNRDGVEYALVTLKFENGAMANVEAHWGYPGPFHTKAEIAGTAGIVRANSLKSSSMNIVKQPSGEVGRAVVAVPGSPGFQSPFELELSHFLSCIETGAEARVTAIDAYRALEIAEAAVRSAETGKAVKVARRNI
ncbi:Gfo/Idh/MocA family protein [Paenibacillus chungangensis]|uniref:Gfo/Idh/MocA family protein n=1 Tax=Paenibacillus chungangensis TaxID=696535 RepID=A0ABW3HLV6_9BACL